jgi:uncharacterized membrane protein YciS (DUF1049 family)
LGEACFSPASLALLAIVGGALQAAIVGLFWLAIRSKDDSIKDARDLRDRALDINERTIETGERQADVVSRAVTRRGKP